MDGQFDWFWIHGLLQRPKKKERERERKELM